MVQLALQGTEKADQGLIEQHHDHCISDTMGDVVGNAADPPGHTCGNPAADGIGNGTKGTEREAKRCGNQRPEPHRIIPAEKPDDQDQRRPDVQVHDPP